MFAKSKVIFNSVVKLEVRQGCSKIDFVKNELFIGRSLKSTCFKFGSLNLGINIES